MKLATLAALPIALNLHYSSKRYLFLLSHMRSYSSLLAHLLGNSPHIDGYGETHVRYRRRTDFIRLRYAVERSIDERARGEWLLDKVLHNYVRPPDRWLKPDQMRAIIFLRSPDSSLRSILSLGVNSGETLTSQYIQGVCDYYVSRLHRLRADGERLGQRALYFDSEVLTQRPRSLLELMSNWLELPSSLSERYALKLRSGEVGFGDPSANILSGRVLGGETSTIRGEIKLPAFILNEARAAYLRCRDSLLRHCYVNAHGLAFNYEQEWDSDNHATASNQMAFG